MGRRHWKLAYLSLTVVLLVLLAVRYPSLSSTPASRLTAWLGNQLVHVQPHRTSRITVPNLDTSVCDDGDVTCTGTTTIASVAASSSQHRPPTMHTSPFSFHKPLAFTTSITVHTPLKKRVHSVSEGGSWARYLVYLCNEDKRCGGWADRQRGMLSVFLLANVTGRRFKVDMRTPCNVTNFLQPVSEDWWGWERWMAGGSCAIVDDMRRPVLARVLQSGSDVNVRFPHTVVYVRTTRDLAPLLATHPLYRHLLPAWATATSQAVRFSGGWRLLAAPTRSLLQRLQRVVSPHPVPDGNTNTTSLVCAHLRMGRNPTMPDDRNVRNNVTAVQLTFRFLQDQLTDDNMHVFIATDDHGVRAAAREQFRARLLDTGGAIVHIDRQFNHQHACAGFESTIVDQLLLSTCQLLVMSKSGFSRHAAYLRAHIDGLFLLQQGSITSFDIFANHS